MGAMNTTQPIPIPRSRPRPSQGKQQHHQEPRQPKHQGDGRLNPWLANPIWTLLMAFIAWKLFLLAITVGSCLVNSEAYDTSGGLVVLDYHRGQNDLMRRVVARLNSWDAIYFVSTARRGYRFEQEWAFGSALPVTVRGGLSVLGLSDPFADSDGASRVAEALVGIFIANLSHLLSVLSLYHLGQLIWQPRRRTNIKPDATAQLLTLVAALLHIISPAGIFLSAPYAESSCSLLTFAGYALYARSCLPTTSRCSANEYIILAGISFGLATWFRSNALLNGVPFAWEVLLLLPRLVWGITPKTPSSETSMSVSSLRSRKHVFLRLASLGIGGVLVAMGSIGPQAVAYYRFCVDPIAGGPASSGPSGPGLPRLPSPSWCRAYLPSIFTYVQGHYWNVGFLRYWVPGNIPLFLLAAPMLAILTKSGLDVIFSPSPLSTSLSDSTAVPWNPRGIDDGKNSLQEEDEDAESSQARLVMLVRSAAVAQVILAVLAVTTYHVQIITRISSGYPLWYWWLAKQLVGGREGAEKSKLGSHIVLFMVMYASIQAALFTSFLPPA